MYTHHFHLQLETPKTQSNDSHEQHSENKAATFSDSRAFWLFEGFCINEERTGIGFDCCSSIHCRLETAYCRILQLIFIHTSRIITTRKVMEEDSVSVTVFISVFKFPKKELELDVAYLNETA